MKIANFVMALIILSSLVGVANAETKGRINVSGTGTVTVQPDEGYITIGVVTHNDSSAKAVRENSETVDSLYSTLKKLGIKKTDLETVRFNVAQRYKEVPDGKNDDGQTIYKTVPAGFIVTNLINVTVCDLSNFGKILDAVTQNGANSIQNIGFGYSNKQAKLVEARALAAKDAIAKAKTMALGFAFKLGNIVSISENSNNYYPRSYSKMAAESVGGSVPVSSGSLSYSVTVNVTWEIEQ